MRRRTSPRGPLQTSVWSTRRRERRCTFTRHWCVEGGRGDCPRPCTLTHAQGHTRVVHLLLSHGAKAGARDQLLRTPLHWAVLGPPSATRAGTVFVVLRFASESGLSGEGGNDVNAQVGGRTRARECTRTHTHTLTHAHPRTHTHTHTHVVPGPSQVHRSVARLQQACRTLRAQGEIACKTARRRGHPHPHTHTHTSPQIVHALLEGGASPAARDDRGRTALHHVASNNGVAEKVVKMLVEAGVGVNVVDAYGDSAL